MAGRDVTEGRAARSIAVDVGVVSSTSVWQNTDIAYNVAIGGIPFIYAINDARPYIRQTAPFRKDQFDNGQEPGEQSLTGWWIRSQASFHSGSGINFYDPATTDENGHYRFHESKGVDVWTKGQVTLLKNSAAGHITTEDLQSNGRPWQTIRSIKWGTTPGVLLHDGYDLDKIDSNGDETHFVNANAGTDEPVYAVCDDGTTAYFVTNLVSGGTRQLHLFKKPLTGDYTSGTVSSTPTGDVDKMLSKADTIITNAVMEYVKERLIICVNNKVYEMSTSGSSLGSPVYTNPAENVVYTSIAASGPAIYISAYNGIQSTILKFTLSSTGVMPTLASAVVAAELPVGEIVHKIYYYLGYLMIGTNKGIRVATISDTDGSITYGPLVVETTQPCYDFAARDHFVWCATSVAGAPGVIRVDLSNELEPLRFAWANDVYYSGVTGRHTTSCAFLNGTERLAYTAQGLTKGTLIVNKALTSNVATLTTSTAHGFAVGDLVWVEGVDSTFNSASVSPYEPFTITAVTSTTFSYARTNGNVASTAVSSSAARAQSPGAIYIEAASELMPTGFVQTGNIRYGTLEPKNFKRLLARGEFTYGSMTLETVDKDGVEYDHIAYDATVAPIEVTTSQPATAQEYVAYKFILNRDSTTNSRGPVFKGYQAKATIATPRQRIMQFPVYCLDVETDKYGGLIGYDGKAFEKLQALEDIEVSGDIVTWQDLDTKESRQVVIEEVKFVRETPPDKESKGFGGIVTLTVRTV